MSDHTSGEDLIYKVTQTVAQMRQGLHHVLFDHALGNPQPFGNFGMAEFFVFVQQEDLALALRQGLDRPLEPVDTLLEIDLRLGRRPDLGYLVGGQA